MFGLWRIFLSFSFGLVAVAVSANDSVHMNLPVSPSPSSFPPTIFFSIYMGKIRYNYFKLTLASMKYNPTVTFVIINIVPDHPTEDYSIEFQQAITELQVPNVKYQILTLTKWKELIKLKLKLDIPFTSDWYHKLSDFKPTLGYLFSDLIDLPSQRYRFWGYGDFDLIWGNFTKFLNLFQENKYYFIRTSSDTAVGMAQFFYLDNITLHIFEQDPEYLRLLSSSYYHNLDENGRITNYTINHGQHSINEILMKLHRQDPVRYNYPKDIHLFVQMQRRSTPTPLVLWSRGNLQTVHARFTFPAGRDLLFAHGLPTLQSIPLSIRGEVVRDMIAYGYLLPNWIPLFTHHMCASLHNPTGRDGNFQLHSYQPYKKTCFGKEHFPDPYK
jgi:hypothetical protein